MTKQPHHYNVLAVCPGRPTIGHAHREDSGVISVMLWCMPLNNQVFDLVPAPADEDEEE